MGIRSKLSKAFGKQVTDVAAEQATVSQCNRELRRMSRRELREVFSSSRDNPDGRWRQQAQDLLDDVSPDHLSHYLVRLIERNDLKIRRGLSFASFMVQESESRRLGAQSNAWLLDNKLAAYKFIDAINVRRPETDLRQYKFKEVAPRSPAVLKPVRSTGSRGCYLIYSESKIVYVPDGSIFSSWQEMSTHAQTLMDPDQRRPLPDRWMIEELILEDSSLETPAPDLKYFTFYGKVLMVLEVRREGGTPRYSFIRPDNSSIKPGGWDYEYFEGAETAPEDIELIQTISTQIPHPFLRIDMLKSEDGLVFGEFTPRPGGYNRFYRRWDRLMGEEWALAQNRLLKDLLAGKRFDAFVQATGLLDIID